jgi:hypothetical protein
MVGKRLIARPMPSALAMALAPHLFGRERHVMRPSALEITGGDFAFAAGHRRITSIGGMATAPLLVIFVAPGAAVLIARPGPGCVTSTCPVRFVVTPAVHDGDRAKLR